MGIWGQKRAKYGKKGEIWEYMRGMGGNEKRFGAKKGQFGAKMVGKKGNLEGNGDWGRIKRGLGAKKAIWGKNMREIRVYEWG